MLNIGLFNGLKHFGIKVDNQTMKIKFLSEIPDY